MTELILAQANYLTKPVEYLIYLISNAFGTICSVMVRLGNAFIASRQASANKTIMDFIRMEYPNENPEHVLYRIRNGELN